MRFGEREDRGRGYRWWGTVLMKREVDEAEAEEEVSRVSWIVILFEGFGVGKWQG